MNKRNKFILISIILLAVFLRVYGLNWDQGQHLHPDERFLTMVGGAIKIPSSLTDYLNPQISTLNPYNVGNQFFVYGTLPLTLNKILAISFKRDNYMDFTLLGRFLSAVFDIGTLILVYKIVEEWERKYKLNGRLKYLAAFFYSISVLPIQHAHFFVVESFLTFFMTASFYFISNDSLRTIILSALFFAAALGTKISGLYILPLILILIIYRNLKIRDWTSLISHLFIFSLIVYFSLRFFDPKFFANGNFFDPTLNPIFVDNLRELNNLAGKNALYFPPAVQWFDKKPVIFGLKNIAFFGLGIPYFLLMIAGFYKFIKLKKFEILIVAFWVISFFLYQSTRFNPSMRYFLFLYPYFAIFAAMGSSRLSNLRNLIILLVLIWPLSFMAIYSRPHSRVSASYWIHQNIPEGSYFAEEHWDDWLPVNLPDIKNRIYRGEGMPVFAPDNSEKWQQIDSILASADYIIFSSNRGYGSIMPQPQLYPRMSKFYQDLFAGKLKFKKIKEFTSYPELCFMFQVSCFRIEDQWSEEAFTVYDHPKVTIFKKI